MNSDIGDYLTIYSPVMVFMGYLLIFSIFFSGTLVPVIFPFIPLAGAVFFLYYLRGKTRFWWAGFPYPLVLFFILMIEFIYIFSPGILFEFRFFAPTYKIIFYLLIAPASLFLFAAMTKEFRKVLKVPLVAASFVSALILLIPLYNTIFSLIFPGYSADYAMSDVNAGFILMIFAGFFAVPTLMVSGILYGFKISGMIEADIRGE